MNTTVYSGGAWKKESTAARASFAQVEESLELRSRNEKQ